MTFASRGAAAGIALACALLSEPAFSTTDFGVRYWYGWGETSKSLYDGAGTDLLSRLTYGGLATRSAELFGRFGSGGVFLKGFLGIGKISGGTLQDEDFPPVTSPYSSTDSFQRNGKLAYGTGDIGYYFVGTENTRLGAFGGFNVLMQEVSGYGCTQTATSPDICVPPIDQTILAITQHNVWKSARIGLSGDVRRGPLQIGGDVAVVYSQLDGHDSHWLRIGTNPGDFTGAVPEDGRGWGYQLEANIDYAVTPRLSIGGGVRYWHMQTTGNAHFEGHVVGGGAGPQRVDWQTTMWGWTARVAWKL